jgi:hypothetical protein
MDMLIEGDTGLLGAPLELEELEPESEEDEPESDVDVDPESDVEVEPESEDVSVVVPESAAEVCAGCCAAC